MSSDEKKLIDVIARAYLAALMPDFRYRQTTVTLDVRGFEFRASGRQRIDLGWRAAFPKWQPADEKGDEAQLLPPLRNGETAHLDYPKIENKGTRPPPRYNEGTLIEAMQNAWRFVDDEVLRERLKEAEGHRHASDPSGDHRRAEETELSDGPGKAHCADRDRPLAVRRSQTGRSCVGRSGCDGALECLLDDVVVGKQEMVGAIDAVCDVAQRIIGKLKNGAPVGGAPSLRAAGNGAAYPPTPAMKRFADSLVRRRVSSPRPATRRRSRSAASSSTNTHPRKPTAKRRGSLNQNRLSPAQLLYAKKIAQGKQLCHSRRGQGQLGRHICVD